MSKRHLMTGLPPASPSSDGYNIVKAMRGRAVDLTNQTCPKAKGFRLRKARQLLAIINAGRLAPSAVAGIERDYARELAKLRKAAK